MSALSDSNPTPSVEEFAGWYNLPDQYEDGIPVLRTVDRLPAFGFDELLEVYKAAEEWFAHLVPASSNEPFDPLAETDFVPRSDPRDRTLDVDHVDFGALSMIMLHRVQQEFLGRYPLWRVIFVADDPSCSIVIYPNAIRFGNQPVDVDPDEALRGLVSRALALREARQRPRREHIAHMQRLLPHGVRAIGDRPFLVCGVLDNYEGDYSRLTICLLIRGSDRDAVDLVGPAGAGDDFLWRSSRFGVNVEGTMISHIGVPETAPFCLVPWLPPAEYRGPLTIVEQSTGKRHTYELKSEDIIRTTGEE
jgi:hypothetical protein